LLICSFLEICQMPDSESPAAQPIELATELQKLRQEVADLRAQVATCTQAIREMPAMLAAFAKAGDARTAAVDNMGGALQRTIDRVEVLENTIRGLELHGGEPGPTGGATTVQ
jgi:cell division septum initiation protein DivIVA